MKTRELLMAEYNDICDILKVLDAQSPQREHMLKLRNNILDDLVKLDEIELETLNKKREIEFENKREKIRNIITISTFGVTTIVSVWGIIKTFRFDQHGTVTSTLGDGFLNGLIPRIKK